MHHVQAAHAVMAKHDERCFVGLRVQPESSAGMVRIGISSAPLDARELEFARLTNVDQGEFLAGLKAALDFLRRDFEW